LGSNIWKTRHAPSTLRLSVDDDFTQTLPRFILGDTIMGCGKGTFTDDVGLTGDPDSWASGVHDSGFSSITHFPRGIIFLYCTNPGLRRREAMARQGHVGDLPLQLGRTWRHRCGRQPTRCAQGKTTAVHGHWKYSDSFELDITNQVTWASAHNIRRHDLHLPQVRKEWQRLSRSAPTNVQASLSGVNSPTDNPPFMRGPDKSIAGRWKR